MVNTSIKPESTQSMASLLLLLRSLADPSCVVHVGAGRGIGELNAWQSWGVQNALIVDADVNRLGWAHQLCEQHLGWKTSAQLISNQGLEAQYHLASNPDEDSLVPMHLLISLWPNIRTVKSQTVASVSLDQLLNDNFSDDLRKQTPAIWCLIDCLPADLILLSAQDSLAKMSVVIARVVLVDFPSVKAAGSLSTVASYLQTNGFNFLQVLETTHSSIGYAVFVRDFKASYEHSVQSMRGQLQSMQITITQQCDQLREQQLQLDRLVLDRDTQLDTVARSSNAIDAKQLEIDNLKQQLEKMESVLAEADEGKVALQGRQTHLHDDLVRAEAQIDLIKELIFTSPPLQG